MIMKLCLIAAGNPEPHLYFPKSVIQAGCTASFQELNETVFTGIYESSVLKIAKKF